MASRYISPEHIIAGEEYLDALENLGMQPTFCAWVNDPTAEEPVLLVVTPLYDVAGPLDLQKTLFKAYNASATPRYINPFMVRVQSPRDQMMKELLNVIATKVDNIEISVQQDDGSYVALHDFLGESEARKPSSFYSVWGMSFTDESIYLRPRRAGEQGLPLIRQWRNFRRNVDRLAA